MSRTRTLAELLKQAEELAEQQERLLQQARKQAEIWRDACLEFDDVDAEGSGLPWEKQAPVRKETDGF